jgi:hypothetical protein
VARLVELTTQSKPEAATHWSTRKMATELGVSAASVSRHWRANGLKPHLVRGFKVSRDPLFVEKLEDIVRRDFPSAGDTYVKLEVRYAVKIVERSPSDLRRDGE